jgi:lactoylglutathione lyase
VIDIYPKETLMQLGPFSISLNVKDLKLSCAFYEKLGFKVIEGDENRNWLIMDNNGVKIGLFQGLFPHNVMTFHPSDVRAVQAALKAEGVTFLQEAKGESGQTHATLLDPDGNAILLE